MLVPNKFARKYENWLKTENFISQIKSAAIVTDKFVQEDLKKSRTLIDPNRFDPKARPLLLELMNTTALDSEISKVIDKVTYKDLISMDTIIEATLKELEPKFIKITEGVVRIMDPKFPFIDHWVEEIKDEIKIIIQTKVSHSLYKKKKIVVLNYKDYEYEKQITKFTKFLEEIIDERIKDVTIQIPVGSIQTQGTAAAQSNVVPLIINNALK